MKFKKGDRVIVHEKTFGLKLKATVTEDCRWENGPVTVKHDEEMPCEFYNGPVHCWPASQLERIEE